jgi:hypothetical protein
MQTTLILHPITMKGIIILFLISTVGFSQEINPDSLWCKSPDFERIQVTHYSGTYGKLRMSGHQTHDSLGNIIMDSKYCSSETNKNIFYYRLLRYYKNGNVKYDSIVDFRKHKRLKMRVSTYDKNGKTLRKKNLHSTLNIKPNSPLPRDSVTWNGKEITYLPSKQKRKIINWKLSDSK